MAKFCDYWTLLLAILWIAWKFETSRLEVISEPANGAFMQTEAERFSSNISIWRLAVSNTEPQR